MIFELAFCVKTSAVVAKKTERERNLIFVNIAAYILLVTSFLVMITVKERYAVTIVFAVSTILVTTILTYSMHKLKKFSSLLVANGILASKCLLFLHLASWWVASILQIVIAIITIKVSI